MTKKRNRDVATNSELKIPMPLQPNVADFRYFKP